MMRWSSVEAGYLITGEKCSPRYPQVRGDIFVVVSPSSRMVTIASDHVIIANRFLALLLLLVSFRRTRARSPSGTP